MTALTVLGLDLSLTGSGIAARRADGKVYVDTYPTPAKMPSWQRHHRIAEVVLSFVGTTTVAVMEYRIKPSNVDAIMTAMGLAKLDAVVEYWLGRSGVPIVYVVPATAKLYATGHGNASKDSMVDAARGRLGHVAYAADHNAADALWFMAMGVARYLEPLCHLPARNLGALSTPDWPTLGRSYT